MPTFRKSFMHISDLHFGHVDPKGTTGRYNALAPAHWAWAGVFRGLLGHHYLALRQLEEAVARLRRSEPGFDLLVTGDLTACGHPDQFASASDYLGKTLVPPKGYCGLNFPAWAVGAILGNHDKWPGNGQVLGMPSTGAGQFPAMPQTTTMPLIDGFELRMIRIDTDADVLPYSLKRVLAMGAFHNQLAILSNSLPPPHEKEIRVLLLHHSRSYGDPRYRPPLVVNARSRKLLDQFLVQQGVQVMLCGHTHVAVCKSHLATHPNGQSVAVLEACCGTTAQWDFVPYQWVNIFGQSPNWRMQPNTLMIHRLEYEKGAWFWSTEIQLRGSRGFKPIAQQPAPFQVWP